jgi:hypothetical protein
LREKQCIDRALLTSQSKRVDVFAVIGAGHELLAETDGVLSLGSPVEFLKVFLGDASLREVDFKTLKTKRRMSTAAESGCKRPLDGSFHYSP